MTPKVILEGTRLTHKTDLAFALNDYAPFIGPRAYRYHPPLVSAEWGAFTPYPWGRGIIDYDEAERDLALETYATWARLFELHRYYSWVVDRFHLSTMAWQRIHRGRDEDFGWLEERLMGARCAARGVIVGGPRRRLAFDRPSQRPDHGRPPSIPAPSPRGPSRRAPR